jgi:ankyrin repeat protein
MIHTVIHPRLTSSFVNTNDDDESVVVAPFSIIGQVPIEEIAHPVLINIEGENRAVYDFDEVVKLLAAGGDNNNTEALPPELAHFRALRERDVHEFMCPQAAARGTVAPFHYMRHLETGSGPLTRQRFTSADIAPVRIVGGPLIITTPDARERRVETINLLLHRVVLDGFVERASALMALRADPSFQPSIPSGGRADSALAIAVRGNQLAMVKTLLLVPQPAPSSREAIMMRSSASGVRKMPLMVVAAKSDPSGAILRELILHHPQSAVHDVCDTGRCALALPDISMECVKALHQAGAKVNTTSPSHDSPLTVACMGGRLDVAKYMLCAMHADPNLGAERTGGATPLHFAAQGGHEDLALLLVLAKANPAARDFDDRTPIHYAVRSNRGIGVFMGILVNSSTEPAKRALLNAPDASGQTPMHTAARLYHMSSLEALMSMGALADAKNEKDQNRTPLHVAAAHDYFDVVARITTKYPHTLDVADAQGRTPLQAALFAKSQATFDLLLQRGARVTLDMFSFAMSNFMWTYAQAMLATRRMPLKDDRTTALHEYVNSSYFYGNALVRFSSSSGRDGDEQQRLEAILEAIFEQDPSLVYHPATGEHAPTPCVPLQYAYFVNNIRAAHMLLRHVMPRTARADALRMLSYHYGGDPAEEGKTLLHDIALRSDAIGLCILLNTTRGRLWIAENIHVKERESGATPILIAIASLRGARDNIEIADRMFHRGLRKRVCLPDACTNCALQLAKKPQVETVEMLLSVGADPAIADKDGFNAIHYWMMAASVVVATQQSHAQAVLDLLPNYLYRVEASPLARTSVPDLLKFLRSPRVTKAWRLTVATNKLIDKAIIIAQSHRNKKRSFSAFLCPSSSSSSLDVYANNNNNVLLEQTKRQRIIIAL